MPVTYEWVIAVYSADGEDKLSEHGREKLADHDPDDVKAALTGEVVSDDDNAPEVIYKLFLSRDDGDRTSTVAVEGKRMGQNFRDSNGFNREYVANRFHDELNAERVRHLV